MKRIYTTLYLLIFTTIAIVAQPRFSSNTEMYEFGQIEWKQPATAHFTITNTGDQPLVLTEVMPDCACSVAHWTTSPIAPQQSGTISVTFDAEALGHFHKSVAVMSNAQPLVYLYFSGQVVRKLTDFTRTHPYIYGDIRMDRDEIIFPDMTWGEESKLHISVANLSPRPYEPVLMHLPSYLSMETTPKVLQQGEKGTITLTIHSKEANDIGLLNPTIYLSRFTGDKVSTDNAIPLQAIILPDFSGMSETELNNSAKIKLSTEEVDVSRQLSLKNKIRRDIVITNVGQSPLIISKLQLLDMGVRVSLKNTTIQPGRHTRLRINISKKQLPKEESPIRILLITNDPTQPKTEIKIKHTQP